MMLSKTSILVLCLVLLYLQVMPLTDSRPDENIASPLASSTPVTPQVPAPMTVSELQATPLARQPQAIPAARPVSRLIVENTGEILLAQLYPELQQIKSLENLPASEALLALQPLIFDADPVIRLAALDAISDMSHPDRSIYLIALLQDPVAQVRVAALEALAESSEGNVVSSIEPLLFDADGEVRLAAIDALAALEYKDAVYALGGLLGDANAGIRGHAVSALGEIGGEVAIGLLQQARHDSDAKIRANADAIIRELQAD